MVHYFSEITGDKFIGMKLPDLSQESNEIRISREKFYLTILIQVK